MNAESVRFLVIVVVTALATVLLARFAPVLGLTDAPRGADAARKHQRRAVPAIGGVALLIGLTSATSPWVSAASARDELWGRWLPAPVWLAATLGLLLAAGFLDDRVGLRAGQKALLQLAALAPLALGSALEHGAAGALVLLVAAFAAVNLLNTFDNADGGLASLCALGFARVAPTVTAACLGFLPFNLDAGRERNRASGAPTAYLGDAGASVLALLVIANPRAAGLLVLPGLDLARLALVRCKAGSRPWIGDRRHLAHRLAARGSPRAVVAAIQCAIACPACALVAAGLARDDVRWVVLGALGTLVPYLFALRVAPEPAASSAA